MYYVNIIVNLREKSTYATWVLFMYVAMSFLLNQIFRM